jgi:hypothetical protein
MLHWAAAGHDFDEMLTELRRGHLPANQLLAIANVPLDCTKLLFVFSGQGSELVDSWLEL